MKLRVAVLHSWLSVWIHTVRVATVNLKCNLLTCVLSELNPQQERDFLFTYIPNNILGLILQNLQTVGVERTFLDQIAELANELTITNSPAVERITISRHLNLSAFSVGKTSLTTVGVDGANSELRRLFVTYSMLTRLPPDLRHLHGVTMIDIRNSPLETVDLGIFCGTVALHTLKLYRNRIRSIVNSAKLPCNPTMQELDLKGNALQILNLELFNACWRLTTLDVSMNPIELVTGSFMNRALTSLQMTDNRIKQLNFCQWTLPALIELKVVANLLTDVPRCITRLTNLTILNLEDNNLAHFDIGSVAGLTRLYSLWLSRNKLESVRLNGPEFPTQLESIDVSENSLRSLNLSYIPVPSLMVYASHNQISAFEMNNISSADEFKVDLRNNPITCGAGEHETQNGTLP